MGKKPADKGREWEKERRDKLNEGFFQLCKLLPDHDPSITMSKIEILRKAVEYIKHLQEKNDEIIKCGKDSYLKLERGRLKKRVAYLIVKTTELVEALRQAGVPIPSKNKKKNVKTKSNDKINALNQQNSDPAIGNKVVDSKKLNQTSKKKVVKCGCEKRLEIGKKPLTEINPLVSVEVTGTTSPVSARLTSSFSDICKEAVSDSVSLNSKCSTGIGDENTLLSNQTQPVKSVNTSVCTTQASVQPLINTSVNLMKTTQTLSVDKKALSKLGPGTLIFADGRIINVPPVIPQLVVKTPPATVPPSAVILMQSPDLTLSKPVVKISKSLDDKKEKLIAPKKREITMTTFVNKVPIPAIKAFRLEPCAREPRKRKQTLKSDQKKNRCGDLTKNNTNIVKNTEEDLKNIVKKKTQITLKTAEKCTNDDQTKTVSSSSGVINQDREERSQIVKYSIDGLFNKECEREKESVENISNNCVQEVTELNKEVTEINKVSAPVIVPIVSQNEGADTDNVRTSDLNESSALKDNVQVKETVTDTAPSTESATTTCSEVSTSSKSNEIEFASTSAIISDALSAVSCLEVKQNGAKVINSSPILINEVVSTGVNNNEFNTITDIGSNLPAKSLVSGSNYSTYTTTKIAHLPCVEATSHTVNQTSVPRQKTSINMCEPVQRQEPSEAIMTSTVYTASVSSNANSHPSSVNINCTKNSNINGNSDHLRTSYCSLQNNLDTYSGGTSNLKTPNSSPYYMAEVFSNSNPITCVPLSLNSSTTTTVNFSSCTTNTFAKPFVPYSVSDVLNSRSSSNFSISDAETYCNANKTVTSYCTSACTYSSSMPQTKVVPRYSTKNDLFSSIPSITTYKSSGNYTTSAAILSKTTSVFNSSENSVTSNTSFHHKSTPYTARHDVYSTYSTPLCSSKPSTFTVPSSVVTTHGPVAHTKSSSNTFTMADLYNSSTKSASLFTMSDITSNMVQSSLQNRAIKPCNGVQHVSAPPPLSEHSLYAGQHNLPTGDIIIRNTTGTNSSNSNSNNNNKNDNCIEFQRSSKDIDRGFLPVMDEVRLTSDFSNDLFSSLQVPTGGGHHSESISPTAAFLLAFPLVSTSKNTDNLVDTENHENHTSTPTTILQIGNIEPPSTELYHSMDYHSAKNKDFEVPPDLEYSKSKIKSKQKAIPPTTVNQPYTSCYPLFSNDYNHCDYAWPSKPVEKLKKVDKSQKYHNQYDCYKQDRKKRKISVNWMTTPENDLYKDSSEYPSTSTAYSIDMAEPFPTELYGNKKNHTNYSWSPSKSLENPLMIPSTLPTLVGDLALGTTTPSDPFKRCDKKDKEEKKFVQPKSQSGNFLSVSQLVDPKCKKQKSAIHSERHYNPKQKHISATVASSSTPANNNTNRSSEKKLQCMLPASNNHHRTTADYQIPTSSTTTPASSTASSKRNKDGVDPACMYPDSFVPHFNWDSKHRYKGGNYSAESLIHQDAAADTFNFNYQQNNFFQNTDFGHDSGQPPPSGCGQYQNFLNFPQGHFSSCVSEEYSENFTLGSHSNNRMTVPPPISADISNTAPNDKSRTMSQQQISRDITSTGTTAPPPSYHCGPSTSASFHHYPATPHHHHHHHQNQNHNQPPQHSGPPTAAAPPPPLPPPASNYSVSTTTTLANFNLSTIFPEINDQRIGTASMTSAARNHLNNTFSNNSQAYGGHIGMH